MKPTAEQIVRIHALWRETRELRDAVPDRQMRTWPVGTTQGPA